MANVENKVNQFLTTLQQRYDRYTDSMDHQIKTLQESSYTIRLQNMSHDIATFDNTVQHKRHEPMAK